MTELLVIAFFLAVLAGCVGAKRLAAMAFGKSPVHPGPYSVVRSDLGAWEVWRNDTIVAAFYGETGWVEAEQLAERYNYLAEDSK